MNTPITSYIRDMISHEEEMLDDLRSKVIELNDHLNPIRIYPDECEKGPVPIEEKEARSPIEEQLASNSCIIKDIINKIQDMTCNLRL